MAGIGLGCKITRILDGDTVEVETAFRFRIRLIDCWCPENRILGRINIDGQDISELMVANNHAKQKK